MHQNEIWENITVVSCDDTSVTLKAEEAVPALQLEVPYRLEQNGISLKRGETVRIPVCDPVYAQRKALVRSYLGKTVHVEIDRPIGYIHHKGEKTIHYPINYGYIPGVLGGDGEELDVFVLGIDKPISECDVHIIGIEHRIDDEEDKLVAAPEGVSYTKAEVAAAIEFQEKYYHTYLEML